MAGKLGKRIRAQNEKVQSDKLYNLNDACEVVVSTASAKFDETVDVAISLGVDPRKADQNIRGAVPLPHGLGKSVRIAVFAKGDKAEEARAAGADVVGDAELVEQIKNGDLNFDAVVATPDMMGQVGKVGKILGPRGLMPSPKVGTVTFNVKEQVAILKAGQAEYRVDKAGIVHASIGKASFGGTKIKENFDALLQAINKAKPSTSKGVYLKNCSMSVTMGPSVKVDATELRNG
jgi:large subunit ribosomal protein L1